MIRKILLFLIVLGLSSEVFGSSYPFYDEKRGKTYRYTYSSDKNYNDAYSYCEDINETYYGYASNYHLFTASSAEEVAYIKSKWGGDSWVQGSCTDGDCSLEGSSYVSWKDGEPNGTSETVEDRIIVSRDGNFSDISGSELKMAICKMEYEVDELTVKADGWDRYFTPVFHSNEYLTSIAKDSRGNIYITGTTEDNLARNRTKPTGYDGLLIKYDENGSRLWVRQLGGESSNNNQYTTIAGIAFDSSDNIYITGHTNAQLEENYPLDEYYDIFIAKYSSDGDQIWIKQFGGEKQDYGRDITLDSDGNIYITGITYSSLGGTNQGQHDGYVAKFDSAGKQLWLKQIGEAYYDVFNEIEVDESGNVYIAGGYKEVNLYKYNKYGTQVWSKKCGTINSNYPYDIITDSSGNIYVTGGNLWYAKYNSSGDEVWAKGYREVGFGGSLSFRKDGELVISGKATEYHSPFGFILNVNTDNGTVSSGSRIELDKYTDAKGIVQDRDIENITGLIDDKGNIYMAGTTEMYLLNAYNKTIFLRKLIDYDIGGERKIDNDIYQYMQPGNTYSVKDSGGNIYRAVATSSGENIRLTKYDENMTEKWRKEFGTPETDSFYSIAIDSGDNIYMTGLTAGDIVNSTSKDNYYNDVWFAKYDKDGTRLWIKQMGSSGSQADYIRDIVVDSEDNIYIAGHTYGDLGGAPLASNYDDVFLGKYDSSGNQIWIKKYGSAETDTLVSLAIDSSGNIYMGGGTTGPFFGPDTTWWDFWVAKYDSNGNNIWGVQLQDSFLYDMAVDSSGNVYAGGYTITSLGGTHAGEDDMWFAKFSNSGETEWIKQIGTPTRDYLNSIFVDSDDYIYIGGDTDGNLTKDHLEFDGYRTSELLFAKYDADGNQHWMRQFDHAYLDKDLISFSVEKNGDINYIAKTNMRNYDISFEYGKIETPAVSEAHEVGDGKELWIDLYQHTKFKASILKEPTNGKAELLNGYLHYTSDTASINNDEVVLKLYGDNMFDTNLTVNIAPNIIIFDLSSMEVTVELDTLKATLHTGTENNRFFAGQLYHNLNDDNTTKPVVSGGEIKVLKYLGIDKLLYSESYNGTYEEVEINSTKSASGYFKVENNTSQPEFRIAYRVFDDNRRSDNNLKVVSIPIALQPDMDREYGDESSFEYGKNMGENFKFCNDVGMDFIGCGVLNLIDNSVDSDGNGTSDYDEMFNSIDGGNSE